MYSTTSITKSSKLSGKIVGTHQRLDQVARRLLSTHLPKNRYFPSSKEIIHFEGTRGPDGLKRKSPGVDEPTHMLVTDDTALETTEDSWPAATDHSTLDTRSVEQMITDHHWNLVQALRQSNHVRAAFEAAWMAHMITDGLTPAHHFPLTDVQEELMTDKEFVKVFGQPIKGIIHGRNMLETARNNWLYWGAGGHMSKHIAYEYGVAMIVAALPIRAFRVQLSAEDLAQTDVTQMFDRALERVQGLEMYDRFLKNGWTTDLAIETRDVLIPEIVRAIALGWYLAVSEAYHLKTTAKIKTQQSEAGNGQK